MVKRFVLLLGAMSLSGCAFTPQVQRFGVEYNEALSSMANEQTLLNILRASKGMPTHFTSVSRFTGSLSMKASGSMNGQLRGEGLTRSSTTGQSLSTATTVGTSGAPTGVTTTNSVLTTPGSTSSLVEGVTEGVDVYTPQVAGELNSGTTFDVQVYDQQKFYQGILSAVPFSTVEMLINQGFEPDLVANLLIARVDFYEEDANTKGKKIGDAVASYRNDATDRARFQHLIDCNTLDVAENRAPPTKIVPISRLDLGPKAGKGRMTLDQLALFDGEKFGLSEAEGISADGKTDARVFVIKPGAKSRIPRLVGTCLAEPKPSGAAPEGVYTNDGQAWFGKQTGAVTTLVKANVVMEITFRSPEAILRAVGEIVRLQSSATAAAGTSRVPLLAVCPSGGTNCPADQKAYQPLIQVVAKHDRHALLETRFMDADYSIPNTAFRSMQVVTIIQQLINLQKEASINALSVPVRAVP